MAGNPRSRRKLQRKIAARKPYDRVLIVCEGKKTEPTYFLDLVNRCQLSTANVTVVGDGYDPRRLVATAKTLEKKERQLGDSYDVVYCVFDRDQHAHFCPASKAARNARLKLARSWPCFEYWLVLHFFTFLPDEPHHRFVDHRRPYDRSGNRSAAQNCVGELKGYLPRYTKSMAGVYKKLEDLLETAMSNAKLALSDAKATGSPNPSTEVHLLVEYLQALKPS